MSRQSMIALARANALRYARGAHRRRIHALSHTDGRFALADLLVEWPEVIHGAPLVDPYGVLRWVRFLNAKRYAHAIEASPLTRLCSLTERQRQELIRALRGDVVGVELDRDSRLWAAQTMCRRAAAGGGHS